MEKEQCNMLSRMLPENCTAPHPHPNDSMVTNNYEDPVPNGKFVS